MWQPGKIVPEFLCTDLAVTKRFYLHGLGFSLLYERPQEMFARFSLSGADLMFEQASGPGRRWITGALERPFGRGINLQIEVHDVRALHERTICTVPTCLYVPMEERTYACGTEVAHVRQFVVQDPDGYLLRFAQTITRLP